MEERLVKVYSKLNDIEENNEFLAIINDFVIKYIDLENNKMTINMENNIIERENKDYLFKIKLNDNKIEIEIKKLHKIMEKDIKSLLISRKNNKYLVRYLLTDENIINEYFVKF